MHSQKTLNIKTKIEKKKVGSFTIISKFFKLTQVVWYEHKNRKTSGIQQRHQK